MSKTYYDSIYLDPKINYMENEIKNNTIQPSSELDEFHYHEALDRTHLIASMIEEFLLNHPVFEKHNHLRESAEKAQELIVDTYQSIGALEHLKQTSIEDE